MVQEACLVIVEAIINDDALWPLIPEEFKQDLRDNAKRHVMSCVPEVDILMFKAMMAFYLLTEEKEDVRS